MNKVICMLYYGPIYENSCVTDIIKKKYKLLGRKIKIINSDASKSEEYYIKKIKKKLNNDYICLFHGFSRNGLYCILKKVNIPIKLVFVNMILKYFDKNLGYYINMAHWEYTRHLNPDKKISKNITTKDVNHIYYDENISKYGLPKYNKWPKNIKPKYVAEIKELEVIEILERKYILMKRLGLVKDLIKIVVKFIYSKYDFI